MFATDALVPIDNNAAERAAALMTLIESAKLCGLDPWADLRDVFAKLPTWPNSWLQELLPHRWVRASSAPTSDTA